MEETGLQEIIDRWSAVDDVVFCEDCMYESIRHWNRNMDPACTYKSKEKRAALKHPEDTCPLAHASRDIHILLKLVAKLMREK
jgi:hypothetical protein